jgi:recombination protein RecA
MGKPIDLPPEVKELFTKLEKKYRVGVVSTADTNASLTTINRIPTGSFVLDMAIGGGVPIGKVLMFWGQKSSFKTSLAAKIVASGQKYCRRCKLSLLACKCPDVADTTVTPNGKTPMLTTWLDTEMAYVGDWHSKLGSNQSLVFVSQPTCGEEAIDVGHALLRSGHCDFMVLDSIAALTPRKEIEKSAADDMMGVAAKLMNRALRVWCSAMSDYSAVQATRPTIIFINQIREKTGVMFGSPETKPAGKGQEFVPHLELKLTAKPFTFEKINGTDVPVRGTFGFRVIKNKTFLPGIEGLFDVALRDHGTHAAGSFIEEESVMAEAKRYGIVARSGASKWKLFDDEFKTLEAVLNAWRADEDLYARTKRAILELWFGPKS